MNEIFSKSIETSKRFKKLIALVAILYVVGFFLGYAMVHLKVGFALSMREMIIGAVTTQSPFKQVFEALETGNLAKSIVLTFFVNLFLGAFISTTLTGVLVVLPIIVTLYRGFVIGIAYYGIFLNPWTAALALGTLVFEFGAYCFSGAAGINIGLSIVMPYKRYKVERAKEAYIKAFKDAGYLYVWVVILLMLGALWEMIGIFLIMHG